VEIRLRLKLFEYVMKILQNQYLENEQKNTISKIRNLRLRQMLLRYR